MRGWQLLIVAIAVLVAGEAEGRSLDQRLREYDLGTRGACRVFVSADAVEARKERWLHVLTDVWQTDADAIIAWIIGAAAPPAIAVQEALLQRDCMVDLLVEDAGAAEHEVIIDIQRERSTKAAMVALRRQYRSSSVARRRLINTLTASEHRDARTQSWIWRRKFVFSGRPFNYVSEFAAAKCDLVARTSWRPESTNHRVCWHHTLSPDERAREILLASAAPGISRHHWGTDVDLFSLNPVRFIDGPHADEYRWMTQYAVTYGFFQPYTDREFRGAQYMEERWHWSYYPIAQALLELARHHTDEVGEALNAQWTALQARWGTRHDAFGYVREAWPQYMFNIDSDLGN